MQPSVSPPPDLGNKTPAWVKVTIVVLAVVAVLGLVLSAWAVSLWTTSSSPPIALTDLHWDPIYNGSFLNAPCLWTEVMEYNLTNAGPTDAWATVTFWENQTVNGYAVSFVARASTVNATYRMVGPDQGWWSCSRGFSLSAAVTAVTRA